MSSKMLFFPAGMPMTEAQRAEAIQMQNQTFFIQGVDNQSIPVWAPAVDRMAFHSTAVAINYAAQIGACFVMLLVVLTMSARTRFGRTTTRVHLATLVVALVRCVLVTLYNTSSYVEFYATFAHDYRLVEVRDTRVSAAASFFAIPQLVLIEVALILQAYSMIQLWPTVWKLLTFAVSGAIAMCAIGFKAAASGLQMRATLEYTSAKSTIWLHKCDLAFSTATIFWFCFIFIFRLVLHMWQYRSVLPPMGGLSAMEVLVMTNGILMLVPAVFAGMAYSEMTNFEAGSLTTTSVVIVLPLGTLVAQHLNRSPTSSSARTRRFGDGSAGFGDSYGSQTVVSQGNSYSRTLDNTSISNNTTGKKRFFGSFSFNSDAATTVMGANGVNGASLSSKGSRGALNRPGSIGRSSLGRGDNKDRPTDITEHELRQLDAVDIEDEMDHHGHGTSRSSRGSRGSRGRDGVWIGREVEVRRDLV